MARRSRSETSTNEEPSTASPEPTAQPATQPEAAPKRADDPLGFFGTPKSSGDMDQIVERVFAVDMLPVYDRLEAELVIGEERSDYSTVRKALDRAEDNARLAHKLYLAARIEQEGFVIDMKPIRAAMADKANRELQREKQDGQRSKAITKEDIENFIAREFADEYRSQEMKELKLRKATEHMERLAELWKSRCRTLDTLLTTMRK